MKSKTVSSLVGVGKHASKATVHNMTPSNAQEVPESLRRMGGHRSRGDSPCVLPFCHPQSCEVHLEGRVTKTRANLEGEAPSFPRGSRPSKLQAEAQWACLTKGFPANAPEMWKLQSQNTLECCKGHSRQWSTVYYASGSRGSRSQQGP